MRTEAAAFHRAHLHGEVCVRSSSGRPRRRHVKRIHIVARRVVLGILSARSCSTEFPSPAQRPRVAKREKIRSISSNVWRSGCESRRRITQVKKDLRARAQAPSGRPRIPMRALVRAHSFDMRPKRIKFLTDDALQFRREGLSQFSVIFVTRRIFGQPDRPKLLQLIGSFSLRR